MPPQLALRVKWLRSDACQVHLYKSAIEKLKKINYYIKNVANVIDLFFV